MNLFIVMCVCVMGYMHKSSTAQQRQGHHSLLLPDCQVCSGNQIQILSKNSKFLTADPPLQHQQIFIEQYFQTKG